MALQTEFRVFTMERSFNGNGLPWEVFVNGKSFVPEERLYFTYCGSLVETDKINWTHVHLNTTYLNFSFINYNTYNQGLCGSKVNTTFDSLLLIIVLLTPKIYFFFRTKRNLRGFWNEGLDLIKGKLRNLVKMKLVEGPNCRMQPLVTNFRVKTFQFIREESFSREKPQLWLL